MKRSEHRILTTHSGALPKSSDASLTDAVRQSLAQQQECGLDIINDGEQGKSVFSTYVVSRLGGIEQREDGPVINAPSARDMVHFPEFYRNTVVRHQYVCTGPVEYLGQEDIRRDIENLELGLNGMTPEEVFMTSVAPATLEHWVFNEHYRDQEACLFALADAMAVEYRAIVEAGFLLQLDNPDLLDGWGIQDKMTLKEFRVSQELQVEAMNHALRDIPRDRVRLHTCWGAFKGPHLEDLPLEDMIDIILQTKVQGFSIEASNVRHLHEWRVFESIKLPEDAVLIPGVIGHASDFVEHPEVIADRLVTFAKVVGRENVIAGTDCGLSGSRIGHPAIAWAKLKSLSEGAALASKRLWR